jgi:hybrid cluster-associated redox disulfide protein
MVTRESRIIDVLQADPCAAAVFEAFGMGCSGCMGVSMETVENGAKMHNVDPEKLLAELNKCAGPV